MAKAGKYTVVRSSAIFGILIALFVGILGFIFTVAPEVREDILPPVVINYENIILDISPGSLRAGVTTEGIRTIPLNDITVDNTVQRQELKVIRDTTFSSGVLSEDAYEFRFSAELDKISATGLMFTVYDMTGVGDIVVYLNGHKVSSRSAVLGSQVIVDLPVTYLKEGANHVEITSKSPGIKFWQTNSVTILDLVLFTDEYDSDKSISTQVFSLSTSEAANADEATLKAFVAPSGESSNVEIKLNGLRLIKATPPQNLELTIPTTALKSGANVFEWSTSRDSKYHVKFANLLVDTVKTTGRSHTYFFDLSSRASDKVRTGKYACTLTIERDSGDELVIVELNGVQDRYDFVGNPISIDVCNQLNEDRNEIKFMAEDELDLQRVQLVIHNKDD